MPKLPLPSLELVKALAKKLDTPEMRKLYQSDKVSNPDFDKELDEIFKNVEDLFGHDKNSK